MCSLVSSLKVRSLALPAPSLRSPDLPFKVLSRPLTFAVALGLNVEAAGSTPTFEVAPITIGVEEGKGKSIRLTLPLLDITEVPDTAADNGDKADGDNDGVEDDMEETLFPCNLKRSRIILQACRIRSARPADDSSFIPVIGDWV